MATHPSETYQGVDLPIEAFYSSSTFGHTENSEHGFTAYVPYLRGVDDHWSLDPAVGNHSARWTREFSGSTLATKLPGMSTVTGLEVTACSESGAALEITFSGSGGPRTYTTRQLRGYLGLRSMQIIRAGAPLPAEPACPQPGEQEGGGSSLPEGGPVTLAGLTIDDDSTEDSSGNADGVAQCGETVEVFTTLTNEGAALTGVGATLTSNDPYVSVRWNTTSTIPDLAPGGSAANDGDWDLAIASDTPDGHQAALTLRVTAANGGPWDVAVGFPVACRTVDATATAAVGVADLDGNGAPEVAMAVRSPKGRLLIKARDAKSGLKTASLPIAGPHWTLVDLEAVPAMPGVVAALVLRDDGVVRVIVGDLGGRTRLARLRYGAHLTPVALAVTAGAGGAPEFAVLQGTADGQSRILVRALDGTSTGRRGFGIAPIDLEDGGDLGAAAGGDLALLGTGREGAAVAVTFDPSERTRFAWVSLGTDPGIDLEIPRDADGRTVVAVLQQTDGGSTVTLMDPHSGAVLRTLALPLASAADLEAVPSARGADRVAVLGVDAGGTPIVITDADRNRFSTGPAFDPAMSPVDLAVLVGYGPGGSVLAALGAAPPLQAGITLWDPVTGGALGTIRVP